MIWLLLPFFVVVVRLCDKLTYQFFVVWDSRFSVFPIRTAKRNLKGATFLGTSPSTNIFAKNYFLLRSPIFKHNRLNLQLDKKMPNVGPRSTEPSWLVLPDCILFWKENLYLFKSAKGDCNDCVYDFSYHYYVHIVWLGFVVIFFLLYQLNRIYNTDIVSDTGGFFFSVNNFLSPRHSNVYVYRLGHLNLTVSSGMDIGDRWQLV